MAEIETNQPLPLADVNLFAADQALQDALRAFAPTNALADLEAFGRRWGSAAMAEQARLANEHPPRLRALDARGFRRDEAEFHPAYHALMAESIAAGLQASTWSAQGTRAPAPAEVLRGAKFYMAAQVEAGHLCPVTMTRASVAALAAAPSLRAELFPRIASRSYDPRQVRWQDKAGMTLGMGMTERQGGTDVRANITRAVPDGDGYRVNGHKWFMSAPMSDAFLVLAQAEGGLTCFLMPRFTPDGQRNGLHFQRLKDKLGNRSNASSEVEFVDAFAWRVGDEGAGIRTILQMVQLTRLDCALASAGFMRAALTQAIHNARHRRVFGRALADQPMMRAVLAELATEAEAACTLALRLAAAFDRAERDPREAAYARLLTPAVKYWVCKRAPAFIYEAMECLGGNGYVEDSTLPRLYREAPVNAIWEGSGNVMALDVLRAVSRDPEAAREVVAALAEQVHGIAAARAIVADVQAALTAPGGEAHARRAVEALARLAACAALSETAPAVAVAEAFATMGEAGATYGTAGLAPHLHGEMIARAWAG